MKKILFLFLITLLPAKEVYKQIKILSSDKSEVFKSLHELGIHVDHAHVEKGKWVEFAIAESELGLLEQTSLNYEIIYHDLEEFYLSRLDNNYKSRDFELGSMGGYYTFEEIEQQLDELFNNYPNLITQKESIGQTLEGRNIWMVKISDNPNLDESEPEVLYTGLHHAREPMSYMNLFYFMNWLTENYGIDSEATALIDSRELYFIPAINPDGLVYNQEISPNGGGMQRKNMRSTCQFGTTGVDLNRNYSYMWGYDDSGSSPDGCNETYRGTLPFSEPESQAVKNFVEAHDFKIALNYHSYSNLLIYPLGYTYDNPVPPGDLDIFIEYGQEMVQYNGYALGTGPDLLYPVNGEACDWMYGEKDIFAYTPEIGNSSDGFWPSTLRIIPLAEENLFPNKFVAWSVGANYSVDFLINEGPYSQGTYYGTELSITNSGLGDSNGSVVVMIDSDNEHLIFDSEMIEIGSLSSRSSIDLGDIITFQVSPNAPNGVMTNININIFDDDNYNHILSTQIIIGNPIILSSYIFEDIENWTVGDLDDNASAGMWEVDLPVATFYEGNQAQPGEDHSPNGEKCFLTGAQTSTGSVGFDDVDGGKTTLFSPIFNLDNYNEVLVSYWRWYTNDVGDNPGTDHWQVYGSSDNWLTSVQLEYTNQSQAEWINKNFLLSQLGLELTQQVQFKFIAEDIYNDGDSGTGGSIIEAAIDDFSISTFENNDLLLGDLNQDGELNVLDVVAMINIILDDSCSELSDLNFDSVCNVLDIVLLVSNILEN